MNRSCQIIDQDVFATDAECLFRITDSRHLFGILHVSDV